MTFLTKIIYLNIKTPFCIKFANTTFLNRNFLSSKATAMSDTVRHNSGQEFYITLAEGRSTLADLGGVPGHAPPMGPNSFVFSYIFTKKHPCPGADPGFDQGGAPDRDRPKTAILGPQFCRIFGAGASFLVVRGGPGPPGPPPWIRPCVSEVHTPPNGCTPPAKI